MFRILLGCVLLAVVGCKKPEDKTAEKAPGGTVQVEGDKATAKMEAGTATMESTGDPATGQMPEDTHPTGEAKVPEGFPLPLVQGAKMTSSTKVNSKDQPEAYEVIFEVEGTAEAVASFYEKAFKERKLDLTRTEAQTPQGGRLMIAGESAAAEAAAVIEGPSGSKQIVVTLTWQVKK